MPEFRYVVVHRPGPNWKAGVPAFEQPGLQAHVEYFASLLKAGKLMMGGPFMDEASGGMMIPEASMSEGEIRAFAAQDPTVKSGLLVFEVRPWMPALHK
ncbi:MAG: YciI family protein [Casimicrobiaceae bacterium]